MRIRFPLMAFAGLSLIGALWAGLLRLGWQWSFPLSSLPANHGPLMIVGFLGTLIGLERAVALERGWSYGASFLAALSALASLGLHLAWNRGVLWMLFAGSFSADLYYDAMLHSIFLGFVFSMIFAHAPIILPSVTGMTMPFQRLFYAHLALLHLSLLLRVGGDLAVARAAQQWGGLLNALAVLLFLANNVRAVILGRFQRSVTI